MSDTIVIAELSKGKISATTNELVTAAHQLGSNCTLVVPCNDSAIANDASSISGVSKIIAAKSGIFSNYDAAAWADVVMMLTPDELQADIYNHDIAENIRPGAAIVFAHGLNVHFNLIEPRRDIDVFMIAPKGPGHTVRSEYIKGGGVPCLIAVHQDHSGNAHEI